MKRLALAYTCAAAFALVAYAIAFEQPEAFMLGAVFAVLALLLAMFAHDGDAPNPDAWRERASYHRMVRDTGIEYISARNLSYTSRDARSHARAYINYTYMDLTKAERATLLKDAIAYGKLWGPDGDVIEQGEAYMRDINSAPQY